MASESDNWQTTLAYIFFGIGAVLLVVGFILLFYLMYRLRKKNAYKEKIIGNASTTYPKLYTSSSAWLKGSTSGRVDHNLEEEEDDSLHLDADAIYAQPTDVRRVYHHAAGEHELSQTESQMGSDRSPDRSPGGSDKPDNIYSTPIKSSRRYIDSEVHSGAGISSPHSNRSGALPALPERSSSRSSQRGHSNGIHVARAQGGIVSPAMVDAENFRSDREAQTPGSSRTVASADRDAALAALEEAYAGEESTTTTPRQLSSRDLVDSVYHVGIPVSRASGPSESHGSVKSYRSSYRYSYYTEPTEPLSAEGEIEYSFAMSVH